MKLTDMPQFKDEKFEQLIRTALNKPTGDITSGDMAEIKKLVGRNLGLSDISGIEYCINLNILDLGANNISNISELSVLSKLEHLVVNGIINCTVFRQ